MHTYVETPFRATELPIVSLDVETTGLDPFSGDRIVEVGLVEYKLGRRTDRIFHRYLNPQRGVPAEVTRIHGLDDAFLAGKPLFAAIADELREFVSGAIVVIQNAPFDLGFLNMEFALCGRGGLPAAMVIDTLELSKREGVAKRHTLDAMCDRYGVDRKHRDLHGALKDSELLGDVFLSMMRENGALDIVSRTPIMALLSGGAGAGALQVQRVPTVLASGLTLILPTPSEILAHDEYLGGVRKASGGRCAWDELLAP
jgi:DNA polymerase-3 subunit epsilon